MKKLQMFLLGLTVNLAFGQCEILGNAHLNTSDTAKYSISNELAQCKQCHQWSVIGNASIIGDYRQNEITLKAHSQGTATLSLQYFSPQGLVKCSKDIHIMGQGTAHTPTRKSNVSHDKNCDINFNGYKEVKMDNHSILFYPDTQQELSYTWEVDYKDGSQETSSEKVPQFTFSENNPILNVHIKVFSKSCYKRLTKTYDEGFWKNVK